MPRDARYEASADNQLNPHVQRAGPVTPETRLHLPIESLNKAVAPSPLTAGSLRPTSAARRGAVESLDCTHTVAKTSPSHQCGPVGGLTGY